MPAPLIDIGVNLTNQVFSADLDDVLQRAKNAGVCHLIVTGATPTTSLAAAELARSNPGYLSATAGCHPHHAHELTPEGLVTLRELAARDEVVAIGECGLDYCRDLSPRDAQARALEAQLHVAAEVKLPVFLHERDAGEDLLAIVANQRTTLVDAVVHCFTGDEATLRSYLDLDLYIGITGWVCDERRGTELAQLIKFIPEDRLLLETDSPFLIPRTLRPRPKKHRNEPSYLPQIAKSVAYYAHRDYAQICSATTANARRFFRLGHE